MQQPFYEFAAHTSKIVPMNLQLTIPDMACSACASTITQAIQALDPTAQVQADTTTKFVTIETLLSWAEVQQVIQQAGYTPQVAPTS